MCVHVCVCVRVTSRKHSKYFIIKMSSVVAIPTFLKCTNIRLHCMSYSKQPTFHSGYNKVYKIIRFYQNYIKSWFNFKCKVIKLFDFNELICNLKIYGY